MANVNYDKIQTSLCGMLGGSSGIEVSFAVGLYFGNRLPVDPLDDASAVLKYTSMLESAIITQIETFNERLTINTDIAIRIAKAQWLWRTRVAGGAPMELPPSEYGRTDFDDCFTQVWKVFSKQDMRIMESMLPSISKAYSIISAEHILANA